MAVFAPDATSGASPPAHRDWCQGTERAEPDLCVKHLNGGFFLEKRHYLHIVAQKEAGQASKFPVEETSFARVKHHVHVYEHAVVLYHGFLTRYIGLPRTV